VNDESEYEVDWMRLWRHDAATQYLYETAAFSRDQAGGLAYPRPSSPGVEGINATGGVVQGRWDLTRPSVAKCGVLCPIKPKKEMALKSVVRYSIFSYKL